MTFEIKQEHKNCIGCGACVSIDPEYWEFNDETNKAVLKGGKALSDENDTYVLEVEKIGKFQETADACPVKCIFLNKKG